MSVDPELVGKKGRRVDDPNLILFAFLDNAFVKPRISSATRFVGWIAVVDTFSVEKSCLGNCGSMSHLTNPVQAEDVLMIPVSQEPWTKILVVIGARRAMNNNWSCFTSARAIKNQEVISMP
jgi:hypothetical protein